MTANCGTALLSVALILAVMFFSLPAHSFSQDTLWLPKRFEHLRPLLVEAAIEMENTQNCVKVINGEMSRVHSTPSEPAFIITCKNYKNRSYTEIVKRSIDELPDSGDSDSDKEEMIDASMDGAVIDVKDIDGINDALSGKPSETAKPQMEQVGESAISSVTGAEAEKVCQQRWKNETAFLQDVTLDGSGTSQQSSMTVYKTDFQGVLNNGSRRAFMSQCYQDEKGRVHFKMMPRPS